MGNQTKFILTVDANGVVVQVQQLGDDGSLSAVPVDDFFSEITVPDGASVSGSGALVVEPFAAPKPLPKPIDMAAFDGKQSRRRLGHGGPLDAIRQGKPPSAPRYRPFRIARSRAATSSQRINAAFRLRSST